MATPEGSPLCLGRYEQPARNDSAFMCGEGLAGAMVVAGDVGALLTTAGAMICKGNREWQQCRRAKNRRRIPVCICRRVPNQLQ